MPRKPINKFLTRGAPTTPTFTPKLTLIRINIVSSNSSKPIKIFHRFPRTSKKTSFTTSFHSHSSTIIIIMAEEKNVPSQQNMDIEEEQRLKYLEFVQVATIHVLLCFHNLYGYAKAKSGPLKPGVESVEGTVKSVVGPVYDKYHGLPIELLKFIDRKVDESVTKLDCRVPPILKQVPAQALSAAQMAPVVARSVASEVKTAGVAGTASGMAKSVYTKYEPAAKELYSKYEPKAEQYAVSAWRKLNQMPLVPQVAQVVVPTAAYCSEKYNQTVVSAAEKGYKVSSYLPLVPTERIAKVFSNGVVESQPLASAGHEADVVVH